MINPHHVQAVIPTYNPTEHLTVLVRGLLTAGLDVIVVDDGSGPGSAGVLDVAHDLGARVLRHDRNRGIAAALNTALQAAVSQGSQWLYTLDQDSLPDVGFVGTALDYVSGALPAGVRIGVLSPAANNGVAIAGRETNGLRHPHDPIQSGSLVSVRALLDVGDFRSDFIIDGVDSEMTARLRKAGFSVLSVPGTDLHHSLGHRVPATFAGVPLMRRGVPVTVNQHAPFRIYYMTRNGLAIAAAYAGSAPGWVVRRCLIEVLAHVVRVAFGRDRVLQLRALRWGIVDGIRGRTGPLEQDRLRRLHPSA